MRRKKILLIDDSETMLMMEQMILRRGYDVLTAKDGVTGVAKAIAERPDLILLDVVMPTIDGFETCRRLRATPETKETPILMVTTRGDADKIEEAFRSGCSDYVTKPLNTVEFLTKIKGALGE